MKVRKPENFDRHMAIFKAVVNGLGYSGAKERFGIGRDRVMLIVSDMSTRIWHQASKLGLGEPKMLNSLKGYQLESVYWNKAIDAYITYVNSDRDIKLDDPIAELDLTPRAYNALTKSGIKTIAQLMALVQSGDEQVLALPLIGASSLTDIKDRLTAVGQF